MAALVMPTWIGKGASQCILARQDRSFKGRALMMDADGCGGLWLHDGDNQSLVTCGTAMLEGSWYMLVACFNAFDGKIRILQRPIGGDHHIERGVLEERSIDLQMLSVPAGAAFSPPGTIQLMAS